MKRSILSLSIAVIWITLILTANVSAQSEKVIVFLSAKGPLTPAMAEYLDRGIARAASLDAELIVFQLDTPGGQIDLTTRMVQAMRASEVPIVVYIAPQGAIAGSAGMVITLAGHASAMASETAIGAASPIGGQGEDLGETIEAKQKEILKATVRSLASDRGVDAIALAESAIDDAKAASAVEALNVGMIDFIADDQDELLQLLDGFTVRVGGGEHVLQTANSEIVEFSQSFIEEFLSMLTNPNIVFLFITIGVQALLIEISSPGGWVAGFIGIVSLALGGYGLGVLPVNWFGLVFLGTSFVLFLLDIKAPTHGALTAAGLATFIIGALVLFNSPGTPEFQRVSIPLVIGAGVATAGIFLVILTLALRAQGREISVGSEAMIGRVGRARTDISPKGMIHIGGELWSARLEKGTDKIDEGERAEVIAVEGLRVVVRAVGKDSS
jgi:membrane-bound serine protease (ClpP class)